MFVITSYLNELKDQYLDYISDDPHMYEDFYEELDNRIRSEQSLNMIYFGPPSSFMRLDSESILHILSHTKKYLIPTTRALLAWDIITGLFH